jgi:ribosome biogenesis ATPase
MMHNFSRSRSGRQSLRQGLDRDVYQIVKKLEVEQAAHSQDTSGKPRLTVNGVYDAIKRSNSSLSRQKRRTLEDCIERVLQFRKEESPEESGDDLDSEAEVNDQKKEYDRFLLNRQLTKHWNVTPGATSSRDSDVTRRPKRRRLSTEDLPGQSDGKEIGPSNGHTRSNQEVSEITSENPAIHASEKGVSDLQALGNSRKAQKSSRYAVENLINPPILGGLEDMERTLAMLVFSLMRQPDGFPQREPQLQGLLLSGPPGTGKKSIVRLLASKFRIPVISLTKYLKDAVSPEKVGKVMTEVFDEAKRNAPCVILIERLHNHMARSTSSQNEVDRQIIQQFDLCMERLSEWQTGNKPVMVIGTTSKPESIDPTLLTEGILESTVHFKVPDRNAREKILRLLTNEMGLPQDFDYGALAVCCHGFVGQDIKAAVRKACQKARIRLMNKEIARAKAAIPNMMNVESSPGGDLLTWAQFTEDPSYIIPPEEPVTFSDFVESISEYTPYMRREGFSTVPTTTWEQVGAMHEIQAQLQLKIIRPIKDPQKFKRAGIEGPAGVLLFGPPGCGKTLVAKAVANDAQASFILIKGPELLNKYVGESERAIRELFNRARSCAPCILFFDEMDSLVPRRENTTTEAGARVVNALLTELDGAEDRNGVYVVGTTNRPDMIDPAILRPGRLDTSLFVDLPTEDERVDILKTLYRNALPEASQEELDRLEGIARDPRCRNFSGADLEGLRLEAAGKCVMRDDDEPKITAEDWEFALQKARPSVPNPEAYRKLAAKLKERH